MAYEATEQTLDYYGNLLGLSGELLDDIVSPRVIVHEDEENIRIQDIRTGKDSDLDSETDSLIAKTSRYMLRKSLIESDNDDTASPVYGTTKYFRTTDVQDTVFPPKVITGSVEHLAVQLVSRDELSQVGGLPVLPRNDGRAYVRDREYIPDMEAFILVSGEAKISRTIGSIALGIRLTEFTSPAWQLPHNVGLKRLNERDELVAVDGAIDGSRNAITFGSSLRRMPERTQGGLTSALLDSVMNARRVEAGNLARPFGGMHE